LVIALKVLAIALKRPELMDEVAERLRYLVMAEH
jgi:hypothetical protein